MMRHASAGKIARFGAGELGPRQSARVRAHLARCARCAQASADLAAVTTLLASTRVPPMPEHLSARIEAALATEAARRAAPTDQAQADGRAAPGRGPLPARRPRLASLATPGGRLVLAAAGAAIVIAGGGYAIVSELGPGTTGATSTVSGPRARPATRPSAVPGALGRAKGAINHQLNTAVGQVRFGPELGYVLDGHHAVFRPVATRTDFRPGTLAAQAGRVISVTNTRRLPVGPAATFHGLRVAALRACVDRLAARNRGSRVVLVDVAKFRGTAATVIVTQQPAPAGKTAPSATAQRQIYVVGPACSATRLGLLDHQAIKAG
jgi:Putative zinc-finger